jgi:hypothetical protein
MVKTGLQYENNVSSIITSGSLAIKSKSIAGINTFQNGVASDGIIYGTLTKPKYNNDELLKSVDTKIFELIPLEPPPLDDTVPRRVYNPVTQSVIDLTAEVTRLNVTINDLNVKISDLEIVSESLRVDVDAQKLLVASYQNQLKQTITKVQGNIIELQNAIQKGVAEAIQRVSLTARNQALKEANDEYKEQLSAKNQALAAGAVSTGQLAAILWEKGDPSKGEGKGYAYDMDLGGGGSVVNGPAGYAKGWSSSWVEISAGLGFDITVKIKQTFFLNIPETFDLKAGETKRLTFNKPNQPKVPAGGRLDIGFVSIGKSQRDYEEDISIKVIDKKSGKEEEKTFKGKVHSYK